MTLDEVIRIGLPAVYRAQYDTRRIYYDGESFANIHNHIITFEADGGIAEDIRCNEWELPDLPADGWRLAYRKGGG